MELNTTEIIPDFIAKVKYNPKFTKYGYIQEHRRYKLLLKDICKKSPAARILLDVMECYMNDINEVYLTQQEMAAETGLKARQIINCLNFLASIKVIKKEKFKGSNRYIMNSNIWWQSYGDKVHLCRNNELPLDPNDPSKVYADYPHYKIVKELHPI